MGIRILHLSDIHGDRYYINLIGDAIRTIDVIVVSGDFEDPEILDLLSKYGKPVYAVVGNMDPYNIRLKAQQYLIEGRVITMNGFYLAGYPINADDVRGLGSRLILVTHYPPYGTGVDKAWNGTHIGSRSVRKLIEDIKPLAVLCGHVHESRGIDKVGNTIIINPGPLFEGYYAIVSINDDGVVNAELNKL